MQDALGAKKDILAGNDLPPDAVSTKREFDGGDRGGGGGDGFGGGGGDGEGWSRDEEPYTTLITFSIFFGVVAVMYSKRIIAFLISKGIIRTQPAAGGYAGMSPLKQQQLQARMRQKMQERMKEEEEERRTGIKVVMPDDAPSGGSGAGEMESAAIARWKQDD